MQVLITGAGGFVGRHLAEHLGESPSITVHGTTMLASERVSPSVAVRHQVDLKHAGRVEQLLSDVAPDVIYHLAAQAFVPRSFEDPWETLENNIRAQLNIITGCLRLRQRPRILAVSSAEIYGAVDASQLPLTEDAAIRPTNPYSVSKVAQDMLGLQYYLSHDLPIMRARTFNHIGPGQNARFVAPAFAMQIAKIEAGLQEPCIYVGNLEARRDFTDVRDIANAYRLIADKGKAGEAYNVSSGKAHSIRQLLNALLAGSDRKIRVEVEAGRLRPVDVPEIRGDAGKLRRHTGWSPKLSLHETLRDVLEDCRGRVKTSQGGK